MLHWLGLFGTLNYMENFLAYIVWVNIINMLISALVIIWNSKKSDTFWFNVTIIVIILKCCVSQK